MTIQLTYNPRLVVLLYCIVISLEIQYNTTRNADYATLQQCNNTRGNKVIDKYQLVML